MITMGSADFTTYAEGVDPGKAFDAAVEQARYDHGHADYSGTIAEKGDFVIIDREVRTLGEATLVANGLFASYDQRIEDKWGPAGALPVKDRTRTVTVKLDRFDDHGKGNWHPEVREALMAAALTEARRKRLVRRGEKPVEARITSCRTASVSPYRGYGYSARRSTAVTDVQVTLTLRKGETALARQTTPDGWLFFGYAST